MDERRSSLSSLSVTSSINSNNTERLEVALGEVLKGLGETYRLFIPAMVKEQRVYKSLFGGESRDILDGMKELFGYFEKKMTKILDGTVYFNGYCLVPILSLLEDARSNLRSRGGSDDDFMGGLLFTLRISTIQRFNEFIEAQIDWMSKQKQDIRSTHISDSFMRVPTLLKHLIKINTFQVLSNLFVLFYVFICKKETEILITSLHKLVSSLFTWFDGVIEEGEDKYKNSCRIRHYYHFLREITVDHDGIPLPKSRMERLFVSSQDSRDGEEKGEEEEKNDDSFESGYSYFLSQYQESTQDRFMVVLENYIEEMLRFVFGFCL